MVESDAVIETLLVLGVVGGLAFLGLAGSLVPPESLLLAGAVVTGIGLVTGLPTGFWYHVALYRTLRPRGPLPSRWWLHPVPLHDRLEEGERREVLRWFLAGGLGFGVIVIGCALILFGVFAQLMAIRA